MGLSASSPLQGSPEMYATRLPEDSADPTKAESTDTQGWKQYDYIVVGGGTAGCVLASRLSEDRRITVLLLEAGRSHNGRLVDMTHIPIAFQQLFKTEVDWDFETTSQKNVDERRIYYPRGKVLGGCSGTNAGIFHHCAPEDFDDWEKIGAAGWGYKDMRPYLLKAEKYLPNPAFPNVKVDNRGSSGHIFTRKSEDAAPVNKVIIEACGKLGIPYTEDLNTPSGTLGATEFIGTIDTTGKRSSTASAYLTPSVLARPNLTVGINVRVERIVFSSSDSADTDATPRASGVIIATSPSSPRFGVCVSREVIVCAGAVATPQLLMLSGVGPAAELNELGIAVVKDLPHVGRNLADHITCGSLVFRARRGPRITLDHLAHPLHGALALAQWLLTGRGPMASIAASAGAFLRADDPALRGAFASAASPGVAVRDRTSGAGAPDIEIAWGAAVLLDNGLQKPPPGCPGLTFSAIALRPESTGAITLASRSVWSAPLIDTNYFASENDLNVLVRGTRLLLRLARTEPLASLLDLEPHPDGVLDGEDVFWPGSADPDAVTDEQLKAWIRKKAGPVFHPVSTARMGAGAGDSVVDNVLRVHGVAGLRVVDASVFPTQVSGHPCAVVVAMAERAAELIRGSL
ncbi:GMC oxidoreductase [Obba rivulosa]|uniref:GMC oxidoreductase n=1 Tax=Obba rivulosa TaxID=1052685 RepID=A0A8E2B3R6_9APHY|nr:GMC oxidoreductase [Obba rivulosa]